MFRVYFANFDVAVYAIWNAKFYVLELDHGCDNIFPKANESLIQALRRVYPDAQIEDIG